MRPRLLLALLLVLVPLAIAGQAAANSGGEKKKGGGESLLQFPALNATILRHSGRRGVLTVENGLDIPDNALRARAEQSMPRLRDAYIRYLQTYAGAVAPGGQPDPEAISRSLQRATDEVLGRPGAKFLLGTVLVN